MRPVTLILPYYRNALMFQEQQAYWLSIPEDLREQLHVIVVDDGSPKFQAKAYAPKTSLGLASFRLYRTLVDVRWNWLFCRNLGMAEASTDWALMTDIDHLLPEATLRRIVTGDLDSKDVYRFSRVDAPGLTPYKPHPNTWLMTRKMFDRIGGYDERFSGHYGTDGEFRDRVVMAARQVLMLPEVMIRVPREVVADASTTAYGRKEPQDANVKRIRDERAKEHRWVPKRLTFPWERVL